MNLLFRLLRVLIHALYRSKITFWQQSVVSFRVLPNDLDCNMHMTNSRYLSIMDLGRVDHVIRSGLGRLLIKNKWHAVLGASNVRYRQSLKPFQSYVIRTRIIGIDEKWCYIEQRFESKDQLVAYALVKGVFIDSTGPVPMTDILSQLGLPTTLPPLPRAVMRWNDMDATIKDSLASDVIDQASDKKTMPMK